MLIRGIAKSSGGGAFDVYLGCHTLGFVRYMLKYGAWLKYIEDILPLSTAFILIR